MSRGVDMIAAERARQQLPREAGGEGWDADHDAGHGSELAAAGGCYALAGELRPFAGGADDPPRTWPWSAEWWKPTPGDRVRELVKAGALIAAAIDALTADEAIA